MRGYAAIGLDRPNNARAVRVVDGVPGGLDRAARIRQLGNSVIPQVAEVIGRAMISATFDITGGNK